MRCCALSLQEVLLCNEGNKVAGMHTITGNDLERAIAHLIAPLLR